MKRTAFLGTAFFFALAAVACGGSDAGSDSAPAEAAAPAPEAPAPASSGEMTMPDWYQMDEANRTVTLNIVAGLTQDQNYWNFNGFTKAGGGSITVPEGYTVVVNFENRDPNMAHSLGIEAWTDTWGGVVEVSPEFDGAVTENPASLTDATMPGESESIQFVASAAGDYGMVCYVPGHAAIGMVVKFIVSSDGSAGVMM